MTFVDNAGREHRRPGRYARWDSAAPPTCRASWGENGSVSVIEINPRFSGGLSLVARAPAPTSSSSTCGLAQGEPPSRERLQFRAGVTMTRHFQEVILP